MHFLRTAYRLQLLLLLLAHLAPLAATCCCCCCDCCCCCCDCCCCGCCCNNNNNNAAAANNAATAAATNLALGAALAGGIPPINADVGQDLLNSQKPPSLGPGLLPDGSTGRGQQPQQTQQNDGGIWGRRRRRRSAGVVAKLDGLLDKINFDPVFPGGKLGNPNNQQQWNDLHQQLPGLGPGLLPDGSTGRRPQQHGHGHGHNNDFFDGMKLEGMHTKARGQRRRRECVHCGGQKCCKSQEVFQLGLLPMDSVQLRNNSTLRFLLGLIPVGTDQADAGSGRLPERGGVRKLPGRLRNAATKEITENDEKPEMFVAKRLFLAPVGPNDEEREREKTQSRGENSGERVRREAEKEGERVRREAERVNDTLSEPPVQFYKPVEANPENADERAGLEDYD